MSKYYVVKKGKNPGIYNSWKEMNEQIQGYLNPVFKAFDNLGEAKDFLGAVQPIKWTKAYTDGSYRQEDHSYSYGALVLLNDCSIEMSQRKFDEKNANLRNVAGEIDGAAKVMEYAYNHKIQGLEIHHDYQGIAAWVNGEWQAKKELTKKYRDFALKINKEVELCFVWVKGHSGEKGNEIVDKLAGNATSDFLERKVQKYEGI